MTVLKLGMECPDDTVYMETHKKIRWIDGQVEGYQPPGFCDKATRAKYC